MVCFCVCFSGTNWMKLMNTQTPRSETAEIRTPRSETAEIRTPRSETAKLPKHTRYRRRSRSWVIPTASAQQAPENKVAILLNRRRSSSRNSNVEEWILKLWRGTSPWEFGCRKTASSTRLNPLHMPWKLFKVTHIRLKFPPVLVSFHLFKSIAKPLLWLCYGFEIRGLLWN